MYLILLVLCLVSSISLISNQKGDKSYSPIFSFNKVLNKKMEYYHNPKTVWFKVYMNIVLLFFAISPAVGIVNMVQAGNYTNFGIIIHVSFFVVMVLNFIFFRAIDIFSFIFNIFANIVFFAFNIISCGNGTFGVFLSIFWGLGIIANITYFAIRWELFFRTENELKKLYK